VTSPDQSPRVGRILGAATLIACGHVASRLLGLVRERTIAGYFGTSLEADAFRAAARLPTMIYDLLIGGMLSAALVPVLASYAATRRAELWRVASVLLSAAAVVTGLIALVVYGAAPWLAELLAGDAPPEVVGIVANSLRYIAPAVLVFGMTGMVTGLLYALERFTLPALAGAVYNLGFIATLVLLHDRMGVYAMALGVTLGGTGQLLLLLPGVRDAHLRPVLDLRHPVVRQVLLLYAPIGLGLVVTQFQVWADTRLATPIGGALATMGYGTNLIQFPHGFVAVAISLAILPQLSAAHAREEAVVFARLLARGVRIVLTLILPAAVGMAVLADPLVGAVFQHGAFTDASRASVVLALMVYLVGLPFAAVDWPLNYAFFARKNTLVPALVGVVSVGVYLAVAVTVGPVLNLAGLGPATVFLGLVLADSAKHLVHAGTMLVLTRRMIGPEALQGAGRTAVAAMAAALGMALVVGAADHQLAVRLGDGTWAWATRVAIGASVGLAIYVPLASRLGVGEIGWLVDTLRQRLPHQPTTSLPS